MRADVAAVKALKTQLPRAEAVALGKVLATLAVKSGGGGGEVSPQAFPNYATTRRFCTDLLSGYTSSCPPPWRRILTGEELAPGVRRAYFQRWPTPLGLVTSLPTFAVTSTG